jgi:hypothetical protein
VLRDEKETMHQTLKRIENERFADLVQNIIKKQSVADIINSVSAEMKNIKIKKLKNQNVIEKINAQVSEMDFMHMPIGEHAGKPIISAVKVRGKYKGLKDFIQRRLFKKPAKPIKIDSKTMDAIFFIHTYRYALYASEDKNIRKVMGIKKGFFS